MCSGEKLLCANTRMKSIGMKKIALKNDVIMPEAKENPNMIGNISKPDPINCLPACKVQDNDYAMSSAPYPQRGTFFYHKTFCYIASHIWQVSCQDEYREFFIRKDHPHLCPILQSFEEYFGISITKNTTVRILRYWFYFAAHFCWTDRVNRPKCVSLKHTLIKDCLE